MTEQKMSVTEALTILGLTREQLLDEKAIMRAYKNTMLKNHPDKNSSVHATRTTQKINEAKGILFEILRAFQPQPVWGQSRPSSPPKRQEQPASWEHKKREKRMPGTRIHRKLESHTEGKAFLDEMTSFFKENFEMTSNLKDFVKTSDLFDLFMTLRSSTTELEAGLFHRHCRKILVMIWPTLKYTNRTGKRGYTFLKAKCL